jgi:hypothetical protein
MPMRIAGLSARTSWLNVLDHFDHLQCRAHCARLMVRQRQRRAEDGHQPSPIIW